MRIIFAGGWGHYKPAVSRSFNLDQRRHPDTLRTAEAIAVLRDHTPERRLSTVFPA
jgi:hypothetical protein